MNRSRKSFCAVMTLAMLFVCATAGDCAAIRVKPDGNDTNDGSSWALAKKTVQAAIDAALPADEVWVAKGTYICNIALKSDTALYGGFIANETELTQRDWKANATILDGNANGSVVTVSDAAATRIDGFTIRNGKAGLPGPGFIPCGGGIYCRQSSLFVANNTITANCTYTDDEYACGGGIYSTSSTITIADNVIVSNSADSHFLASGGGIYCSGGSASITNNSIASNTVGGSYADQADGGGIYCSKTSATIAGNVIADNALTGYGSRYGGGIYCSDGFSTITNNTIVENYAFLGGGVYLAQSDESTPKHTLSNNIIAFNSLGLSATSTTISRNNNVYGNNIYDYSYLLGAGDISVDPQFVSREYGDFHLRPISPCANSGWNDAPGAPSTDMDGQPRIQGTAVDMGADECDGTERPTGPWVVVRVSPDGDDSNDGSTWPLAKRTVQAGIDAASIARGEVWVKSGLYNERIALAQYVYLCGGFAGSETTKSQRDWTRNRSILDGGAAASVVTCPKGKSGIDGFTIRNGKATHTGGGIHTNGSTVIANNTITGNTTLYYGGGISCEGSTMPVIVSNTVGENSARGSGGIAAGGGSTILNNVITNNTATGTDSTAMGGGLSCWGCAIVRGNLISDNTAPRGGGVSCGSYYPYLYNNTIKHNKAISAGGGVFVYASNSYASICGNLIVENEVSAMPAHKYGYGGGIYGGYRITNNTIAFNSAVLDGGGVYGSDYSYIRNNIVAFNSSGLYGGRSMQNNDVFGNTSDSYSVSTPGISNISADPLFINPTAGNYHLKPNSPCRDAGYDAALKPGWLDIDGQTRIQGLHVDIGADEIWPTAIDARKTGEGTGIGLSAEVVTAAFPDFFYIEEPDRSSGIRVEKPAHGLQPGMRADVTGTAHVNTDGEACIVADLITPNGSGAVMPFALNVATIGGGACGNQAAVWGWRYEQAPSGLRRAWGEVTGLNNIGLLVRTTGRITERDPAIPPTWFMIDDGSGVGVKCVVPSGVEIDPAWGFVGVTGISSCEKVGEELHRLLRVRQQSDVVPF